jgi:hypothetical protein
LEREDAKDADVPSGAWIERASHMETTPQWSACLDFKLPGFSNDEPDEWHVHGQRLFVNLERSSSLVRSGRFAQTGQGHGRAWAPTLPFTSRDMDK